MLPVLLLMLLPALLRAQYAVHYTLADAESASTRPALDSVFPDRAGALRYLAALPASLQARGYVTASIDSLREAPDAAYVRLFLGRSWRWARLDTHPDDAPLFATLRWNATAFTRGPVDFARLRDLQERLLGQLEESGYPFARVYLDSVRVGADAVDAQLRIDRGPLYHIDSIRVYGDVRISNELLQRQLDLPPGTPYSKRRLQAVDKRLAELPYLQTERPSDLTMLATGSVLNVYLKDKKTNQVNALVGFLPNPDVAAGKKVLITGEANLLLRNALGGGETMGLNWQQLQQSSPRLHILFQQPYFLRTPVGLGFDFEMFRKDTTFLNLNFIISASYRSGNGVATLFFQRRSTIVNGVNQEFALATRRLPPEADVRSNNLGASYDFNNTDYRFNPRSGNELVLTASAGIKNIKKNAQLLALKDPGDPTFSFERLYDTVKLRTYQLRIAASAAHYFPLGRQGTLRTAVNAGAFFSGNVFRNELFQIGGYRLLRGFDEESQYLQQYAVGTVEYRYLIGQNSHFFGFLDGGWGRQPAPESASRMYLGTGLGISFETKAGIFNLAWALGRRDDLPFNLRRSKVHLGFVSYF